ncbi:MAG: sugar-binding transcriptional regulator [Ardenticatenaceae bacterium]|nr:sugar-binding transcriptional regulator [Ardenticatenaceae bacterium]HBY95809.1 hypothetical protein [Chloroflexota bacterium]
MLADTDDHLEFLAHVAHLYYKCSLTQAEIARQIGVSRSSVSRMLTEATDRGVVEIRINYPAHRDNGLEARLQERFRLSAAYVLRSSHIPLEQRLQRIARLAVAHLEHRLRPDLIFGLSWGTSVYETVTLLRRRTLPGARVVQFIGAIGRGNRLIDGPELARYVATTLGAEYHYLHAPLVVATAAACRSLLAERTVAETLELARQSDLALVGIGSTSPSVSSLIRAGYLTEAGLQAIESEGAVGDICARHFDIRGQILDIDINRRIVGISPDDLRAIPEVIGVAGGPLKAPAILGALRGELVDTLVTDDVTVRELLRLDAEAGQTGPRSPEPDRERTA